MSKLIKSIPLLVIALLLVGMAVPAASTGQPVLAKLHPMLAHMAAESPGQPVSVIVQKADDSGKAEQLTAILGGAVTKDLRMINAFAAQMTAGAALELAASPAVRWVSIDAPVKEAGGPDGTVDTNKLANTYISAIGADRLWDEGYQGSSVTVAVVDSGVASNDDLRELPNNKSLLRILSSTMTNTATNNSSDQYGHGTHIAGIIGGNGYLSKRTYIGVAPKVKLVNVKVSDDKGAASTSDLIAGLQWVNDNRERYTIRVLNLSLNSTLAESYHTSPLDAALEILWFNGIVVVVSAGNNGTNNVLYPPANDPFVIVVGAVNDQGTDDTSDDLMASFSAFGTTLDGFAKPDLVAPGNNIVSLLASPNSRLAKEYKDNRVGGFGGPDHYFRMSGTSMASAVTSGAVALLLQDEPGLNPDQVKYRLMATARPFGPGSGAGYLDVYAAVQGTTTQAANTGQQASQLLWTGSDPVNWGSVNWGSVNWGSVNWGSVNWGSVNWGSVNWGSDYWGP